MQKQITFIIALCSTFAYAMELKKTTTIAAKELALKKSPPLLTENSEAGLSLSGTLSLLSDEINPELTLSTTTMKLEIKRRYLKKKLNINNSAVLDEASSSSNDYYGDDENSSSSNNNDDL